MGNLDAALKRYYRSINQELPCSRKMKKQIMQRIQDSVTLFLEQNPNADFNAVQAHFGTAQEIASSYVDTQDAPALLQKMCIKKKALAIVAGVLTAALLVWVAAVVYAVISEYHTNEGYYVIVDITEN